MELDRRGISQIVFGFLPQQTVDLRNRTWRVIRWSNPNFVSVDQEIVRKEILQVIRPFSQDNRDNELASRLRAGSEIHVLTPSRSGVEVESFPKLYRCKNCSRLMKDDHRVCKCGTKSWAAFPFVSYHTCGMMREPFIDVCQAHKEVRVNNPRSNNARDLKFTCPVCGSIVQTGFRFIKCECGDGTLDYNVHKAGIVFNPHSAVIVNPPNEQVSRELGGAAAQRHVLAWVLNGMLESRPLDRGLTLEHLVETFMAGGVSEERARKMARAAAAESEGALASSEDDVPLAGETLESALDGALKLAYATAGGRTSVANLSARATPNTAELYSVEFPRAIGSAKMDAVELLDDFPVLTAFYGYTRGDSSKNPARLRWYRDERGSLQLYGLRAHTEALLFRVDPVLAAAWLYQRKLLANPPSNAYSARLAVLETCVIPRPGDSVSSPTAGSELLTLLHSCSHRMMRTIAAFAGIDRDALSEYLIPQHLAFVVYARSTSDFVLGGLQALFENDLHNALGEFVQAEARCPLDPGCAQGGDACMACLHTGEPSCRYFNQFLRREVLFGPQGFMRRVTVPVA